LFDIFSRKKLQRYFIVLFILLFSVNFPNYVIDDLKACALAASGGHLECLMLLANRGYKWDKDTCFMAAEKGHLECLRYVDCIIYIYCFINLQICT
jgi:hypothetical protein